MVRVARPLFERSAGWSDAGLFERRERLFAEISREGQARGSNACDGKVFEYNDRRLGSVHEAVASRTPVR